MVYESVSVRGIYYYKINEINIILMEGSQLVNLSHLFSGKVSFWTCPHCHFRGVDCVCQGIKQILSSICGILDVKLHEIDAINQSSSLEFVSERTSSIYMAEREIKSTG